MTKRLAGLLMLGLTTAVAAQQAASPNPPSPPEVIEKVTPSVAMVLVGTVPAKVDAVGSAVVVRENGILLTAYHVVKDAKIAQIRFKNGETFDDVQLLGIDARRDIAAIRINGAHLPTLTVSPAANAKAGDPVYVVSHPEALPWSASAGIVSAYRMADEVPGAGAGFRLLQFTAPASPGSSGGVVVNGKGELMGLVIGGIDRAQNLNFAVPVESVLGLSEAQPSRTFGSGASLLLPAHTAVTTASSQVNSDAKPVPIDTSTGKLAEDLQKSEILKSKEPDFILRNFRTMYIDAGEAKFFNSDRVRSALGTNAEFTAMHVTIVTDRGLADVVLEVGYTFAFDFPFTLKHQNTSIALLSGKGVGVLSGPAGADSVARTLVKMLKPYRVVPVEKTKQKKQTSEAKE